jgi:tRNA U34 5-carboxymethylaminomethyl modifying GTPase MnmE/TrmE
MLSRHADPIAAIATAPGRGAVGIVRVSGKSVQSIITALCGKPLKPREATYLPFADAQGNAIDQGLAIHFPFLRRTVTRAKTCSSSKPTAAQSCCNCYWPVA